MKQKFRRLTRVRVAEDLPEHKSHFPCDFVGIVEGTYSQLCGGGSNIDSYSLYELSEDGKEIVNSHAWYEENQLTETPYQNREEAEEMIEKFNLDE